MDGEAEEHFKFVDKENEQTKEVEDENKKENREELQPKKPSDRVRGGVIEHSETRLIVLFGEYSDRLFQINFRS